MGRVDKEANATARSKAELESGVEDEAILAADKKSRKRSVDTDDDAGSETKRRGRLFWFSVVAMLACAYLAANFLDVWWASRQSYEAEASAAIVLGAAQYNGEPSPALRGRLDTAAELYAQNKVTYVVVTGGGREGDATTQAKASYDYLRSTAGIPDERLFLEVEGTSTYEELAASSRFLAREGLIDVILVTDPYHAKRAALVAAEVGLIAEVHPTDASAPFDRLAGETLAVSAGRILTFRRLEQVVLD